MNKIYTITCFTQLKKSTLGAELGAVEFMGWYENKEDAIEAVKLNAADINETIYDYAIVEEIEEGLYQYPRNRWLFKYNRTDDRYFEIEEPPFMKYMANIL